MVVGVAVHHDTLVSPHLVSVAQFQCDLVLQCQQRGWHGTAPHLPGKEVPAEIREGQSECGNGARWQGAEGSVQYV